MISEGLKKLDNILGYIIPNRYVIGRTPEIFTVFDELATVHEEWIGKLEKASNEFLQVPHHGDFIHHLTTDIRDEFLYFRQKAVELGDKLDEDDLIPMAPEVVNFLNSLQNYLISASGKITLANKKQIQFPDYLTDSSFIQEENFEGTPKTVSPPYSSRTETTDPASTDLGFKLYTLINKIKGDWTNLVLGKRASEIPAKVN